MNLAIIAQTDESGVIVYFRPQTEEAIEILDTKENNYKFVETRPPPPELCDTRLERIPERIPASYLSFYTTNEPNSNVFRESTPGPYSVHPRVLRLGFGTKTVHTEREYYFGSLNNCQVKIPYNNKTSDQKYYFYIRYNFNSGTLLIVTINRIKVRFITLKKNEFLFVILNTIIDCDKGTF